MGGLRPDRCHSPMAVQLRSVSVTVTLASIEWAELVATRNHFRNVASRVARGNLTPGLPRIPA